MIPFQFNERTIEDFRKGMCFLLSHALYEKSGWKIVGVCEERFILHAVSCPHSGGLIDVKGYFQNNQELLSDLSYSNRVKVRGIELRDIKDRIEGYNSEQRRYGEIVAERVLSSYQKKVKV